MKANLTYLEIVALRKLLAYFDNIHLDMPFDSISTFFFTNCIAEIEEILRKKSNPADRTKPKLITFTGNYVLTIGLAFQLIECPLHLIPFRTNLLNSLPSEFLQHLQQHRKAS